MEKHLDNQAFIDCNFGISFLIIKILLIDNTRQSSLWSLFLVLHTGFIFTSQVLHYCGSVISKFEYLVAEQLWESNILRDINACVGTSFLDF